MAQKRISILADNKFISKGGILLSSIGVLLFTVLGLGGCKNVDKKSPQQIFHYNEDVSVTTLDPAFVRSQSENWIVSQIFNGLIDLDAQLQPVPALAKSWEISTDLLTYTFHLRSDVNFCFVDKQGKVTTRKMVASDVAYSLSRIADPATSSPGAWIFVGKIDSQLNRVFIAPNDSTFVLKLVSPAASLLGLLSTNFGYVVPKEYARLDKSYLARNPVGTGPFYVRRWEDEIKLVMRKNPHYHEKDTQGVPLPYLDAINVTFVKNKQTAFMQFAAGTYDFFNGLEGSFKDELLTDQAMLKPKYAQKMKAIITPFLNTEYVGCYLGEYPGKTNWLKDVHLRRALFYAVDKQKLVRFFRNGLGDAGDWGVVPPILNVLRQLRNEGKLMLFRGSWIADYPDAENFLACYYAPYLSPMGPNYTHFEDAQFDTLYRLIEAGESGQKASLRKQYIQQANQILIDQAPVIPLYYDKSIRLIQPWVQGLENDAANRLVLKRVKISR